MSEVSQGARGGRAQMWAVALGVAAGWIAILPASTLAVALRLKDWQLTSDAEGYADYSLIVLIGWVALIVSLAVAGRVADRLVNRGWAFTRLLLAALAAVVLMSVMLAIAPTPVSLGIFWALLQPAAAVLISLSLGWGGHRVDARRRNQMSGLVGAAPLAAMLVGAIFVRLLGAQPVVFVVLGAASALLVVPLVVQVHRSRASVEASRTRASRGLRSYLRSLSLVWIVVLLADFFLSSATSITNSYAVALFDEIPSVSGDVAAVASGVLLIASLAALLMSLLSGLVSTSLRRSALAFGLGGLILGGGVCLVLVAPSLVSVYVGGALIGVGFGVANGAEMALVLHARARHGDQGSDLGLLNAVTSLPYVLVPALALVILSDPASGGVRLLFAIGLAASLLSAALAIGIARSGRARAIVARSRS